MGAGVSPGPCRQALWVGKSPLLWKLLRPGPAKTLASQGQVRRLGRLCPGRGGSGDGSANQG
jgi:hypothetical protein